MTASRDFSNVIIDVTETSRRPNLTGIQRLVRETVTHAPPGCHLVRFDFASERFIFVESIPDLVVKKSHFFRDLLHWSARTLFPEKMQSRQGSGSPTKQTWIWRIGVNLFERFLSDFQLIENRDWKAGRVWSPRPGDHYVSLEVHNDSTHRKAVRRVILTPGIHSSFYVHDSIPMSHPHLFPPTERDTVQASFLEYVDLALSGAEIVANSQTTLNGFLSLNEKLNPDRSVTARVLYPPLRPLAAISSHARAEVSQVRANPEEIRLLGVGALNARKNFAVAIKALLILLEMNHSVKLSLVGGGHRHVHGEIQDLLRKFPRKYHSALTIFPAVSDEELENHYLDADIVLVPSKAEGFGLPILEAAVRLRPVIASDAEVFREIGQGLDVSFANEDNPEEWANRVISIAKRKTQEIPSQNSFDRFPATAQEFAHQLLTKK